MTDAELLTIFRWQCFACIVLVLLIVYALASAVWTARQVLRDRRTHRLNHPLTLRPSPFDDCSTSAA